MTREKRPDEIARENAPVPTEPMGTVRVAIGTVKWWRDAKGYGVIATDSTASWDIWCHFSVVEGTGFRTLQAGQHVEVEYIRLDQESFKYVARHVRCIDDAENRGHREVRRTRTMRLIDWYARHHVKLGIAGLAVTAVLNLLSDRGRLFEPGWWATWFPSYIAWAVVLLIGVRPARRSS